MGVAKLKKAELYYHKSVREEIAAVLQDSGVCQVIGDPTGTGEQTSFTTFGQRCDQVDNLNSSFQNLRLVRLLRQIRSRAVNWR